MKPNCVLFPPKKKLTKLLLLLFLAVTPSLADDRSDLLLQSQKPVRRPPREKLSHLRFYRHEIVNGRSPTVVRVVKPAVNATSLFGEVVVMDEPLTLGPELCSKLVGRAQGLYSFASKDEVALLMAMNLVFVEGKYNGSTIATVGRNAVFSSVRETPVVGGSGLFRLARGYAQATTHNFDLMTLNAVVEYNVFVTHHY